MRSLFAVLFFLVFANSLLFADQIAFKNGDRLTGAILKSDAKILVIRTAVVSVAVVVLGVMIYVSKSRKSELGDEIKKAEAARVSA